MKPFLFLIFTSLLVFSSAAHAGLCEGSPGCWGISCNNSIECESAGCGACSSGYHGAPKEPKLPRAASEKAAVKPVAFQLPNAKQ